MNDCNKRKKDLTTPIKKIKRLYTLLNSYTERFFFNIILSKKNEFNGFLVVKLNAHHCAEKLFVFKIERIEIKFSSFLIILRCL